MCSIRLIQGETGCGKTTQAGLATNWSSNDSIHRAEEIGTGLFVH